jgi:hypothetical protein
MRKSSLQRAATPRFKLFGERVIEPTDATSTRRDAHEGGSHFSHGCRVLVPATNIWVKLIAHLLFRATRAIKEVGVERSFPVSGHFQLLDLTSGGQKTHA